MKFFIKKIIFLIIIPLIIIGLKRLFTPYYIGDVNFKNKHAYYSKNSNKFNTILFGSSRVYRQINPEILDSILILNNTSTFNFATASTINPETYFLYENYIKSIDSGLVKNIIIELQSLNSLSRGNSTTTKGSYWNNEKKFIFALNYISDSNFPDETKQNLIKNYKDSYLNNYINLEMIPNLLSEENFDNIGKKGFYPLEQNLNEKTEDFVILEERYNSFLQDTLSLQSRIKAATINNKNFSTNELNDTHLKYLKNLILESKQKGINLIFLIPPRLSEKEYSELIVLSENLPKRNIIKIFQYPKYKELYAAENSFDVGHLNNKGAIIFSNILAQKMKNKID